MHNFYGGHEKEMKLYMWRASHIQTFSYHLMVITFTIVTMYVTVSDRK